MHWPADNEEAPVRETPPGRSPAAPEPASPARDGLLLQRVENAPAQSHLLAKGSVAVVSRRHPEKTITPNEDAAAILPAGADAAER